MGFVARGDQSVAICMACDMELQLSGISSFIQEHADVSDRESATFTQVDGPFHRDAIRFRNGRVITLQALGPGVVARVCDTQIERPLAMPLVKEEEAVPVKEEALV
ncbi:MAG: hypothetical protein JSS54_01415 [Proteobacteria bacterium]|nr:hypothetical protein [Pseudomonadota bacterium]